MNAGQVTGVRELKGRVQAKVCLGSDVKLGYAYTMVETTSPKVLAALTALKDALREDALEMVERTQAAHIQRLQDTIDRQRGQILRLQEDSSTGKGSVEPLRKSGVR